MPSESPTDRELLLEILWRLRRIEERLSSLESRDSERSIHSPQVPRKPDKPGSQTLPKSQGLEDMEFDPTTLPRRPEGWPAGGQT